MGPYSVPAGTVAPLAFAVSDSQVFAVVSNAIYRLPLDGAASGVPIALSGSPSAKDLIAAHAGGTLLVGDALGPAQVLSEGENSVRLSGTYSIGDGGYGNVSITGLYGVHQIATSGTRFAISLLRGPPIQAHLLPESLELNASPCSLGSTPNLFTQLAAFGDTIAWVEQLPFSHPVRLRSGRIVDGVCTDLGFVEFGMSGQSGTALGLVDENLALVVDYAGAYTADVAIIDRRTAAMVGAHVTNLNVGSYPVAFAMGLPHHAVVITKDRPALLEF
jgi:hypothetical protein